MFGLFTAILNHIEKNLKKGLFIVLNTNIKTVLLIIPTIHLRFTMSPEPLLTFDSRSCSFEDSKQTHTD